MAATDALAIVIDEGAIGGGVLDNENAVHAADHAMVSGNPPAPVRQRPVGAIVPSDPEQSFAAQRFRQWLLVGRRRLVLYRQSQKGFGGWPEEHAGLLVVAGRLAVIGDFDPDEICADQQALAVLQGVRTGQPGIAGVDEGAVRRQVVEQVPFRRSTDLAMPARHQLAGIG
nr:hypothetical protein [Candidatus Accumulibacter contiguus]